MRNQTREALLDFPTLDCCGTWVDPEGHLRTDSTLKLDQKRRRHKVLVDQVNLPDVWPPTGRSAWRHVSWSGPIVRGRLKRRLKKSLSWRRSLRKYILFVMVVKHDQTFVSARQNGGDVVEAVGDTDAMRDGPSMGWLSWLLLLDEDGDDGSWIGPRNERGRRSAPLIQMPLPWLRCQPGRSRCCRCR